MEIIKSIPTLTAGLTFAVLGLAFAHEWAFFLVVGSNFQSLLSVSDYFNSAIGWLPFAFVSSSIGVFFGLIEKRSIDFASREERIEHYKRHPWHRLRDEFPYAICLTLVVLVFLSTFLSGDWYSKVFTVGLAFFFWLIWSRIVLWMCSHAKSPLAKAQAVAMMIAFVPAVLAYAFATGLADGADALTMKEPVVYGRLEKAYQTKPLFMLRALSAGVLIRELDGDVIRFVKWDDVVSLEQKIPSLNRSGLYCRLNIRCP